MFINTTDENGHYERMIHPDDLGTFFVTVSSPGYLDDVDIIGTEDNFGLLDLDIPRFLEIPAKAELPLGLTAGRA